jgi:hypothetical protein
MAKLEQRPEVGLKVTLVLDEAEARALDALAGYGDDAFLQVFYKHLGGAYLRPHEKGLRSLLIGARATLMPILGRLDKARKAFET